MGSKKPSRIQFQRGKKWPQNTVYVGRPSQWGNEFKVEEHGRERAVNLHRHELEKFAAFHPDEFEKWIAPLRGKHLACWCKPGEACHADTLLELANAK